MEIEITTKVKKEIKYLCATMGVRYWCDCEYSTDGKNWIDPCVEDTEEESDNMKNITPFVVNKDIGYRPSDYWEIIIDIDNGKVLNWPDNFWLKTHYKVCDDGKYVFLDENMNEVINITEKYDQYYVPDFLALEDSGYGDYVYLNIDNEGNIEHANIMRNNIIYYFEEIENND